MIGTDYTPGLLAELAKKPNVRIPATPKGQLVSSCTKRYTDDGVCKTTLFEEGRDKISIVLSPAASVELTSFYEDETSDEPY